MNFLKAKKGEMGKIYGYVLLLGMVGVLLGVVLTVLGKFAESTGITTKAEEGINKTVDAIYDIPNTWLPIVVIVAIAGVILYLVVRFGGNKR